MIEEQKLQILIVAGRELGAFGDMDDLLLHVVRCARQLTGAAYTSIGFVEGRMLHWRSAAGKPLEEVKGYHMSIDEGLCGWVVRHGRPRRTGDVTDEPDYFQQYAEMRSELDVPIKTGDHVIGVLSAESPAKEAFTYGHELLIEILADYVTQALREPGPPLG